MIPVNGYETGGKPNWGTKTVWQVDPVKTAYQNIHDRMEQIRKKISKR